MANVDTTMDRNTTMGRTCGQEYGLNRIEDPAVAPRPEGPVSHTHSAHALIYALQQLLLR